MPIRLLFQDEGRFGRISDLRRCWAPLPCRPVVGHQVIREYIYAMTAVSPLDGRLTSLIMPWVDSGTMSIFLAHTEQTFAGDFCLMLLDGAGWHRAKELRVPETIKLIPLPAYSPELNPVEHIWEYLRENIFKNFVLQSLDEVIDLLADGLKFLSQQPEIVRSMTCFDWFNTLCLTYN
jgi:hypothetical protein